MRAAGRHTAPPGDPQAGPTAASRPGFHLAGPATSVRHATSPPCRPGNRHPPCDQPTLQPRQPPSARHAALLHTGPTAAARRRRSPREANGCFTAPPPLHSQKGQRGQSEGPAAGRGRGGEGCNRKNPQPHPAGLRVARSAAGKPASDRTQPEGPAAVSNRGRGGEGCNRKARSRIRQGPAGSPTEFFAGFVPFASLNIRFERVQTASQPYFYSRKRFTPRPHTHQIQPVAAPRQRSAPAGGSRDRHPLRLEDSLPFRPSVRHPETHGSGCRFVGS